MRTSPDAREYEKAAPNATPSQAFHAGVLHERTRQRSLQKAVSRGVEDAAIGAVAMTLLAQPGSAATE